MLDTVLTSALGALQATGDFFRAAANTLWHLGRLTINSTVTFLAWLYAESRDADRGGSPGLIVTCVNARPQGFWQSTTFQLGNLTLSSEARVDPVLQGHETRHADQWALLGGGLLFPLLYGLEQLRVRGRRERNLFERWAGLQEGGYTP